MNKTLLLIICDFLLLNLLALTRWEKAEPTRPQRSPVPRVSAAAAATSRTIDSSGDASAAHYEMVGTGQTGNAESVQVVFDPRIVSYGQLLRVYFSVMDPTTLNYQEPDRGTQYRSEIFTADPEQQRVAAAYVAQLEKAHAFSAPIVTQLGALKGFYRAESYHQDFLIRHPDQLYIAINDLPKIEKLKRLYTQLYVDKAVTVARNGG